LSSAALGAHSGAGGVLSLDRAIDVHYTAAHAEAMAATKTISVSVPKDLADQVKALLLEGESMSAFVAQAITNAALRRSSERLVASGYYDSPDYLASLEEMDYEREQIERIR
jgi:hypothetical protein